VGISVGSAEGNSLGVLVGPEVTGEVVGIEEGSSLGESVITLIAEHSKSHVNLPDRAKPFWLN